MRAGQGQPPTRQTALAELCQRLVMETYAPAAVLINRKHECLYSLGPADRYLRVAQGFPSHDLQAMAAPPLRTKLRAAIQQASQKNARIVIPGGRHQDASFSIAAQPVVCDGEDLLLICFIDEPAQERTPSAPDGPQDGTRIAELEQDLEATRAELQGTNRIEAGTVQADVAPFPVNDLLTRLREEFTLQAQANHLTLSVLPCNLTIESDPRLLEQMLRNLVSNALKYTTHGRVLLGAAAAKAS